MISETDAAYVAGLFDGEGSIQYKQYDRQRKNNKKPYPTWSIRMEVSMTDRSVLLWMHSLLGCGTVNEVLPLYSLLWGFVLSFFHNS